MIKIFKKIFKKKTRIRIFNTPGMSPGYHLEYRGEKVVLKRVTKK